MIIYVEQGFSSSPSKLKGSNPKSDMRTWRLNRSAWKSLKSFWRSKNSSRKRLSRMPSSKRTHNSSFWWGGWKITLASSRFQKTSMARSASSSLRSCWNLQETSRASDISKCLKMWLPYEISPTPSQQCFRRQASSRSLERPWTSALIWLRTLSDALRPWRSCKKCFCKSPHPKHSSMKKTPRSCGRSSTRSFGTTKSTKSWPK